jgi:hypothetical protein
MVAEPHHIHPAKLRLGLSMFELGQEIIMNCWLARVCRNGHLPQDAPHHLACWCAFWLKLAVVRVKVCDGCRERVRLALSKVAIDNYGANVGLSGARDAMQKESRGQTVGKPTERPCIEERDSCGQVLQNIRVQKGKAIFELFLDSSRSPKMKPLKLPVPRKQS